MSEAVSGKTEIILPWVLTPHRKIIGLSQRYPLQVNYPLHCPSHWLCNNLYCKHVLALCRFSPSSLFLHFWQRLLDMFWFSRNLPSQISCLMTTPLPHPLLPAMVGTVEQQSQTITKTELEWRGLHEHHHAKPRESATQCWGVGLVGGTCLPLAGVSREVSRWMDGWGYQRGSLWLPAEGWIATVSKLLSQNEEVIFNLCLSLLRIYIYTWSVVECFFLEP